MGINASLSKPPEKSQWMNASREMRKHWIHNMFIKHPKVSMAIEAISRKVDRCIFTGTGDGIFILGQPGSGKTRLIRYISELYDRVPDDPSSDRTNRPVIKVKIPDTCTRKQVMVEILEGLGADSHGSFHQLMKRAVTLFKGCNVRLVLIDDLQDIPARRSLRGVHDIAICIRELIDSTNALFVLCGNKDALVVLDSDLQLRKRIPFRVSLQYFDLYQKSHIPMYMKLIHKLDQWIPLAQESCITDRIVMERLFFATNGIFQYIVQILDLAWPIALDDHREHISIDDLKKSFRFLYGDESDIFNPFSHKADRRLLNKIGEPFHGWS